MEILNRVNFLFRHVMVIKFIPEHGILLQVTSKALIMASFHTRPDMQNECVKLVDLVLGYDLWQDVFEI